MINVFFSIWVLISAFRGYRAGLLSVVLGGLGFVLAYFVCFIGAEPLAGVFRSQGLNAVTALLLAAIILFSGTSFLISILPGIVLKKITGDKAAKQSISGAILGGVLGVVSGLALIWCYSLISAAVKTDTDISPLEKQATKIIGSAAEYGVDISGLEGVQATVTRTLFRQPNEFVASLRSLAKSSELKQFMNDAQIQRMMASNDVQGLMQTPGFIALSEHEGVVKLLDVDSQEAALTKKDFAEKITLVWQRMELLKNDQQIQAILQDGEVKRLIQEQNPVALLANDKIQVLVSRVMDDDVDLSSLELVSESKAGLASKNKTKTQKILAETQVSKDTPIFRWLDENGVLQYSDYNNIPTNKRDSARLVGGSNE